MNKNIRSFELLITVAIITTLLSCNTAVDVELEPYELQLVGNCILQKDSDIKISSARKIVSLRNKLIHEYDVIDDAQIWNIIVNHLPQLKKEIQQILDRL